MSYLPIVLLAALFGADASPHQSVSRKDPMLRAFNSFQLVGLFAGMPYLLSWLNTNPFPWSPAAFWTAIVAYLVLFVVLCVAVFSWSE